MPGVTISSSYGTGGSVVASLVAERLGLPLLDRAITSSIAEQLRVSIAEAEDARVKRSRTDRFLGLLAPLVIGVLGTEGTSPGPVVVADDARPFRERAELIMQEALSTGAIILGRAGAAAFRTRPDVLRVRLFGPPAARMAHAAAAEHIDPDAARRRQPRVDDARRQYVRRLYDLDIDDPELYDLQIDSTRLPADACADLIARAYRALPPISQPETSR